MYWNDGSLGSFIAVNILASICCRCGYILDARLQGVMTLWTWTCSLVPTYHESVKPVTYNVFLQVSHNCQSAYSLFQKQTGHCNPTDSFSTSRHTPGMYSSHNIAMHRHCRQIASLTTMPLLIVMYKASHANKHYTFVIATTTQWQKAKQANANMQLQTTSHGHHDTMQAPTAVTKRGVVIASAALRITCSTSDRPYRGRTG